MAEASEGVGIGHEDGSLEIHLAYDDMLRGLRGLEAEQDGE